MDQYRGCWLLLQTFTTHPATNPATWYLQLRQVRPQPTVKADEAVRRVSFVRGFALL